MITKQQLIEKTRNKLSSSTTTQITQTLAAGIVTNTPVEISKAEAYLKEGSMMSDVLNALAEALIELIKSEGIEMGSSTATEMKVGE